MKHVSQRAHTKCTDVSVSAKKKKMKLSEKQVIDDTAMAVPSANHNNRKDIRSRTDTPRTAILVTIFICFIGFLVFLVSSASSRDTLSTIMRIDFGLGVAMCIFGFVAILRHHNPLAIKIFASWFLFNAVLSLIACTVFLVGIIQRMSNSDQSWGQGSSSDFDTVNHYKDLICAIVLTASCVFWLFAIWVLWRFYAAFRRDYMAWKEEYKQDTSNYQMDASFHQWRSRHVM